MLKANSVTGASPAPAAGDAKPLTVRLHGLAAWRATSGQWQPLERKHAALLAYLHVETTAPRNRLAALLWPGVAEARARGNLRQRLSRLRQELGEVVLDAQGMLSLAPHVSFAAPDPPAAPLLDGLEFDDCRALARWIDARRDSELGERKRGWLAQVREAAGSKRLDDALFAADQLLQSDRESEEAFRVLMEIYYLRGDHGAAIAAWDRCRTMLRQLYGVAPSGVTRELGETILAAQREAEVPTQGSGAQLPATVLRPPRLVGRSAGLRALLDGWHAGHALWVAGVAGIGKSRLLSALESALGPCAVAAARPGDAVLPYASLSRLVLAAVDRFAPPLDSADMRQSARLLPRLARQIDSDGSEALRTDYERSQALHALARVLRDCMHRGCVAFMLDDLQFADASSLAALRVLADPAVDEAQAAPLRFAFAIRIDEGGADAQALLDSLAESRRLCRVALSALSDGEASELLASLGVAALDDGRLAHKLWKQLGGNPAFLLESVKLLLTSGAAPADAGTDLPLPASIEAVIARRVEMLSPRARHLAQLAAIAGTAFSIPLAAAALACAPMELSEPLRELEQRQVFYGRQFVHDVIATVVARIVPQAIAEFLHRFVAEHLVGHDGDAATIAEHWAACGEWRRSGRCYLQAAAAAEAEARANDQAQMLDRAIASFEKDPGAQDELFEALWLRSQAAEAPDQSAMRPAMNERMQATARTEAQRLQALCGRIGLLASYAQAFDHAEVRDGIERALAIDRRDLAYRLATPLGWRMALGGAVHEGLAVFNEFRSWIEASGSVRERALHRRMESVINGSGDRLVEAIAQSEQAVADFRVIGDWLSALPVLSNLGFFHWTRGEFELARLHLVEARALRERLHGTGASVVSDLHYGAVLRDLGQTDAAVATLEAVIARLREQPDTMNARSDRVLGENHLAQLWISAGEPERAAVLLGTDSAGIGDRFVARRLALRLRLQRRYGSVDSALRDELARLAATLDSPYNRVLSELELLRLAPPQAAAEGYEQAYASPGVVQRPGLQLHVAALAAAVHASLGRRRDANKWRRRAQELLSAYGPVDIDRGEIELALKRAAA